MRKVLIITYYWPPAGGGGVQRWLKFAKYLPETGWSPVVYTPSNADYPLTDVTLGDEIPDSVTVIRRPIREPRRFYRKLLGKKGEAGQGASLDQMFYTDPGSRNWKEALGIWVRGNLFIPDARVWWVRPSVRFLRTLIEREQIKTIITTGPPHSMHLIGLGLKQHHPDIRWLADFRDPWTSIEYYDRMRLGRRADHKHRYLERQVLQTADTVITVSPSWAAMFGKLRGGEVGVITNGYDPADFASAPPEADRELTICHVGTLAMDRNPVAFWSLLSAIADSHPGIGSRLTIKLLGSTDPAVIRHLSESGLKYVDLGYRDHRQAVSEMRSAHFLLLLINQAVAENVQGRIPGKVFEYLAAGRPVIAVSDEDTDATRILADNGHLIIDPDDEDALAVLSRFISNPPPGRSDAPEQFSRSYLARQWAQTLSQMKNQKATG